MKHQRNEQRPASPEVPVVRAAIYTRKSSEQGLGLSFNSLDAQRESAEAYIASQRGEGWVCLPDRYDDGGYSGGNTDRPAFQRLKQDIIAGKIDVVVIYKLDRLSRNARDFLAILDFLEEHRVGLASVTQSIQTTGAMGKFTLHIMVAVAQLERDHASERTKDKIALARQRGQWSGGRPILGFDIESDRSGSRLIINPDEAEQVRRIFSMYIEHASMMKTIAAIDRLGWATKRWMTRQGKVMGGAPFNKARLHLLLSNVLYIGRVRHGSNVYDGLHDAIVPKPLWDQVQTLLARNAHTGGAAVRNAYGAILKGLVRCSSCDCAMTHTHTSRGIRRWRYYACANAQKRGVRVCPNRSVSAHQVESFVVNEIRVIGRDPALVEQVIDAATRQVREREKELATEGRIVERDLKRLGGDLRRATDPAHIADLQERIRDMEMRRGAIAEESESLHSRYVAPDEVRAALAEFDAMWQMLSPREQARVLHLLVERVTIDKTAGTVAITFKPTGLRTLGSPSGQQPAADAA